MESKVPEASEQIAFLLKELAGHEAFGRLRRTTTNNPFLRIVKTAGSPSAFCRTWDEFATDARIIGNMLARLHRDGWTHAAQALENTLSTPGWRIPGETFPIEETTLVTILILDFPRTLAMIRWIRAKSPTWNPQGFPTFPDRVWQFRSDPGKGVILAYHEAVLNRFDVDGLRQAKGASLSIAFDAYDTNRLEISSFVHIEDPLTFGFVFEAEQRDVLEMFDRNQQEEVTTWSVRIPRVLIESNFLRDYKIGFFPEHDLDRWEKVEANTYPSLGCHHGYGAVLTEHDSLTFTRMYHENVADSGAIIGLREEGEVAFLLKRYAPLPC